MVIMFPSSKNARVDQPQRDVANPLSDNVHTQLEQGPTPTLKRSQFVPDSLQILGNLERSVTTRRASAPSLQRTSLSECSKSSSPHLLQKTESAITDSEKTEVMALFPDPINADRVEHDVFRDAAMLRRQLAHENKIEITAIEYARIRPFGDDSILNADFVGDSVKITVERNVHGDISMLLAKGQFTLPEGWQFEDKLIRINDKLVKVKTTLIGPDGKSGMIQRSFDGRTLFLDKAYKSTLPSRLEGVEGFDHPVALINYMTARACKILGVTSDNLKQIKVHRLQHRGALAHLDWLSRRYPEKKLSELIDHTTWARSYIRGTSDTFGHKLVPAPTIDLENSDEWKTAHPGAQRRNWSYLGDETKRLSIEHITDTKIAKLDDPDRDCSREIHDAIDRYKEKKCENLSSGEATQVRTEIDARIQSKITAVEKEEAILRQRYALPENTVPTNLNFDVTYRTVAG
jgi:hypothetical protein